MTRRLLTIAKRLPGGGWTKYQPNKQPEHCDDCGARLYVAPDGRTLYCDQATTKHKETVK